MCVSCTGQSHRPTVACSTGATVTRSCADLRVYLEANATSGQIDAVGAALRSDPNVASLTYLDKPQVWSEFSSHMSGDPNMTLTVADTPSSYYLALRAHVDRNGEQARYKAMPGVYDAVTSG